MSKELADRVVKLGIGQHQHFPEGDRDAGDWYGYDSTGDTAETFVRDGRVVLALMEKLDAGQELTIICCADGKWSAAVDYNNITGDSAAECSHESQPIAIATACCEALEQ